MGSDKYSIVAWWICIFLAFVLWFRNSKYDRIVASIFFVTGFLQLIDYGAKGGMNQKHAGKLVYVSIWLICFIVSVSVYVYTRSPVVGAMCVFFLVIFLISCVATFGCGSSLDSGYAPRVVEYQGGVYDWVLEPIRGGTVTRPMQILGSWWWLWALGIIIPLLILFRYYPDPSLMFILLFAAITYIVCKIIAPNSTAILWAYSSILILFVAYAVGMFSERANCGRVPIRSRITV